jgi:hypothetical protein
MRNTLRKHMQARKDEATSTVALIQGACFVSLDEKMGAM